MTDIKKIPVCLLDRAAMWGEFTLFLPLLARLPLRLGYLLATWRGTLNWALDREWRSIALGQRYIRAATNQALKQILPDLSLAEIRRLTRRRFETNSREEFEACLLMEDRVREMSFSVRGLESVREQSACRRGIVLLTAHFDSFILGIVFLGISGLVVNVMTSDVVENPLMDGPMRRFFYRKYRGLERYLQGGRAVHVEQNLRFFYQALLNGECVVVLADLPTSSNKEHRTWMPFLGRERSFLSGAFRLAQRTRSALAGFICQWEGGYKYKVTLSECIPPEEVNEASYQQVYAFLETAIQNNPERWWAADLLRTFETR
jgi:lauroyl/myristoyl acyltransferase